MSNTLIQNQTQTGLSAIDLAAALTTQQWAELDHFALKRLRRAASSPARQRALALLCPRSLGHTAVERFALADAGLPGGRKLQAHQRKDAAAFIQALRGAINSLINHALEKAEFSEEHLPVGGAEAGPDAHEPHAQTNLPAELELRDLTRSLFARLTASAGQNGQFLAAVESLRDDCITGHATGISGTAFTNETKRQVRQLAQQEWKNLTL